MAYPLPKTHRYIRVKLSPPSPDALLVRRALQDALSQTFGLVSAGTYMDILWVEDEGKEAIIRVAEGCVFQSKILESMCLSSLLL